MPADAEVDPEKARGLEEVAEQLRDAKLDMAIRAADWIRQELQSYEPVLQEQLLDSVQVNLERAVGTLLSGTVPTVEAAENRAVTRQRMDAGAPIGDIIRAYRISLTVIYQDFLALAESAGMTAAQILHGSQLLWQLGDWFTAGAAAEYRYNAAQSAVRKALERAEVVRRLIDGEEWPAGFEARLRDLGIEPGMPYRVLLEKRVQRTTPAGDRGADRPAPAAGLRADIDGQAVLIWPDTKDPHEVTRAEGQCWAAGPSRPLPLLEESAEVAYRILRALPSTSTGVHTMEDVGWRLVLPLDKLTQDVLSERYLGPLEPGTRAGTEVLETLQAFLDHGRNVRRTAEALTVHQNTVRYRLERFERATGATLQDTEVVTGLALVLAWWSETR
ncbi:PucR family transcriptional regulator [Citricoccus nitrophenolicus]|uniref:PucR family transcriptional regulator n=1 Tax=Citricoccus nitrophenolicus TaxID=863575 RepID=UPI0039B5DCD1